MPAAKKDPVAVVQQWEPYSGQSYADLTAGAAVSAGADLVPGDLLLGVPFVTTSATFRTSPQGGYVSLEIVTGDEDSFLKAAHRGRISPASTISPGEELVFNEGGTGVYRSVVKAWAELGWIVLPDGEDRGPLGESRLDTPISKWTRRPGSPVTWDEDSNGDPVASAPIRLWAKRGLRLSEYANEHTKEGRTRYFG